MLDLTPDELVALQTRLPRPLSHPFADDAGLSAAIRAYRVQENHYRSAVEKIIGRYAAPKSIVTIIEYDSPIDDKYGIGVSLDDDSPDIAVATYPGTLMRPISETDQCVRVSRFEARAMEIAKVIQEALIAAMENGRLPRFENR